MTDPQPCEHCDGTGHAPTVFCACGEPAEFLCDHELPLMPDKVYRLSEGSRTCDTPLCDDCRNQVGVFFACGPGGWVDSVDLCEPHARLAALSRGPVA